jgi:hypothetical protein
VGRVRADGQLTFFWRSQEIVAPQAFSPTSEQLAERTAEKVPTLEGLLHQIEVRIDPALTHNQFWLAVAIGRKNEVSVSAFQKVLTNALRRQ